MPSMAQEASNPMGINDWPERHLSAPRGDRDPSQEKTIHMPAPGEDVSQAETKRVMASGADTSGADAAEYETVILAAVRSRSRPDPSGASPARSALTLRVARAMFILILSVNVAGLGAIWGVQTLSV